MQGAVHRAGAKGHGASCAATVSVQLCSRHCLSRFVQGLVPPSVRITPPWRTMFFGTDDYALTHLKALNENRVGGDVKLVDSLEVVVPRMRCAVRSYAQDAGLRLHEWPLPLMPGTYDVGVVVSFGHLIPKRVIDFFPYGILNVHPSILPRWRGASPIIHTILNGDRETGISIMEIRPIHFDIGPLLLQSKFPVPDNCTTFQLRDYLALEGCNMLMHALRNLPSLEQLEYEQNEYGVTYAHKVTALDARVNWEAQSPESVDRQYRALSDMFGLRSQWRGQTIRLLDMVPLVEMQASDIEAELDLVFPEHLMTVRPGIAYYLNQREILCIRCQDGWVGFHSITYRKSMTAKSFYNGYLSKTESRSTAFDSLPNELERRIFKMPTVLSPRLRMNGAAFSVPACYRLPDHAVMMNVAGGKR
jgi:methionyl-tRNA formyltransferase